MIGEPTADHAVEQSLDHRRHRIPVDREHQGDYIRLSEPALDRHDVLGHRGMAEIMGPVGRRIHGIESFIVQVQHVRRRAALDGARRECRTHGIRHAVLFGVAGDDKYVVAHDSIVPESWTDDAASDVKSSRTASVCGPARTRP